MGSGSGIRLPHAPDIPTLGHHHQPQHHAGPMRTKPRSNTTGGLGNGYYGGGHHGLHHSSSNSSLHSLHSQHSGHGSPGMHGSQHGSPGMHHQSPSMMPSLPPMQMHDNGNGGPELYRRGSMPDMGLHHGHGWDDGMGGVSVKEEPRAVLV